MSYKTEQHGDDKNHYTSSLDLTVYTIWIHSKLLKHQNKKNVKKI